MKKQKKVAKPRTGKSKRAEVQRRQALKQLRRKITEQANERFQQQLLKQKSESSSEIEPCFQPVMKKRKRVLINESINQQHSHEEWINLRAQHVLANEQSHSKQQTNVVERVKTRQRSRSDEINY